MPRIRHAQHCGVRGDRKLHPAEDAGDRDEQQCAPMPEMVREERDQPRGQRRAGEPQRDDDTDGVCVQPARRQVQAQQYAHHAGGQGAHEGRDIKESAV